MMFNTSSHHGLLHEVPANKLTSGTFDSHMNLAFFIPCLMSLNTVLISQLV